MFIHFFNIMTQRVYDTLVELYNEISDDCDYRISPLYTTVRFMFNVNWEMQPDDTKMRYQYNDGFPPLSDIMSIERCYSIHRGELYTIISTNDNVFVVLNEYENLDD